MNFVLLYSSLIYTNTSFPCCINFWLKKLTKRNWKNPLFFTFYCRCFIKTGDVNIFFYHISICVINMSCSIFYSLKFLPQVLHHVIVIIISYRLIRFVNFSYPPGNICDTFSTQVNASTLGKK